MESLSLPHKFVNTDTPCVKYSTWNKDRGQKAGKETHHVYVLHQNRQPGKSYYHCSLRHILFPLTALQGEKAFYSNISQGSEGHRCTDEALTSPLWRALAVVGVDSVHAGSSISTLMTGAVINVVLAVGPIETWCR